MNWASDIAGIVAADGKRPKRKGLAHRIKISHGRLPFLQALAS
jgi:hypothetical protein